MGISGNILVPVAFLSWVPFVIFLYKKFEKRLVPVIAYVAGWMFLPCANVDIFLLKNTKPTVIGYGLLVGAWIYDRERLRSYKYHAMDLPMILWCTTPLFSSLTNGLGVYDGLAGVLYTTILWGLPYYFGRVYFTDSDILKTLAVTIFIGGLVYVPFSWFELIMSPQLHRMTYGFHQHDFAQTVKDGGYRPMVYMNHGLMASMWMSLASLLGLWLFITKLLPKKIMFVPSHMLLASLILTTMLYQSMASLIFFLIGAVILYLGMKMKQSYLLVILLIIPSLYIVTRSTGYWDGTNLTQLISERISPERAESVQFRMDNEAILVEKAQQGGFFGWGGYGRSRVYDDNGDDISVTDGLWVITYGTSGIYGLTLLIIMGQLPSALFFGKIKPEQWGTPALAAPSAIAVFLGLTMVDNLLNAMVNPIYLIFNGGLLGLLIKNPVESISMHEDAHAELINEINRMMSRFLSDPSNSSTKFIS